MKTVIILQSYHHNNTEKIANVFSKVLDAPIKRPADIQPDTLSGYDLVCFGSGIYSDNFNPAMLEFADKLPHGPGKRAFLFSTAGMSSKDKAANDHSGMRKKLESKGYMILGEYQCPGFNTNSFLRCLGGMNKGHPNSKDMKEAEALAIQLKTDG